MLALGVIAWLGAIACTPVLMRTGAHRSHYGLAATMIVASLCAMLGTTLIGRVINDSNHTSILYIQGLCVAGVITGCLTAFFEWRYRRNYTRFQAIFEERRNQK